MRRILKYGGYARVQRITPSIGASRGVSHADFGFKTVNSDDKETMVKGVFSRVASKYDIMNDVMSFGLHRLWKDCFVAMIGLKASSVANSKYVPKHLDVAGGTGDIAFRVVEEMFRYYPTHMNAMVKESPSIESLPPAERQVVVCDINVDMLKVGESRAVKAVGAQESKILGFVEGNAEALPFPDATFDIYTIAFGLRNVTDKQKALAEAYRVLRPGGRIMILEFSHLSNPGLQYLYDQYSFNVIPKMGKAIANDEESYQYLVESIRKFPKQEELQEMVTLAGFKGARYEDMQFGVVSVHSGFKL
jgi:2-methoxy-6-polyprenyl-1,4-benzoquinol methylase